MTYLKWLHAFSLSVLLMLSFAIPQTLACGWYYTLDMHGNAMEKEHGSGLHIYRYFSLDETLKQLEKIETALSEKYSYKAHSDYAMLLSRIGKVAEALAIMERLNQEHPDEYILMANLGTLYELHGKPKEALHWIQTAMELNPDSHYGSEWIHVDILKAKLEMQKDPDWLKTHRVLDIDVHKYEAALENKELAQALDLLERHLNYQLHERIPYTPSPDPIVFQLLMDYGALATIDDLVGASTAFIFARVFTDDETVKQDLQKKIQYLEKMITRHREPRTDELNQETDGQRPILEEYTVIDFFSGGKVRQKIKKKLKQKPLPEKITAQEKGSSWFIVLGVIGLIAFIVVISRLKRAA